MQVGDIVRYSNKKNSYLIGLVIDAISDDKICVGEPVSFYRIMWASGIIGDYNEYFCKSVQHFEVISVYR